MISNIFNFLKQVFLFNSKDFLYKVQDIDTCADKILLTHGSTGATLSVKLSEIYSDKQIIRNLAQHHCCWIGYYFGRIWKKNRISHDSIDVIAKTNTGNRFLIVSVNRDGEIVYCDTEEDNYKKASVDTIANSKEIMGFYQDDAFYIGFLCGVRSDVSVKIKSSRKHATLRVIK